MTTDSRCAGEIPCYLNDNGECVATDDWMCTRPLLIETGRDKQPNDQLTLF